MSVRMYIHRAQVEVIFEKEKEKRARHGSKRQQTAKGPTDFQEEKMFGSRSLSAFKPHL